MAKKQSKLFGLIGHPLSHSFSKKFFTEKFEQEGLKGHQYQLFPLPDIAKFSEILDGQPHLHGLNVTIPHKQSIIYLLDEVDDEAAAIGAVNVIQIRGGKLKGYNSDIFGFELSLRKFLGQAFLQKKKKKALVLGTGGASKAVVFVLKKMGIDYQLVSRREKEGYLTYGRLTPQIFAAHQLIINCTPLGTSPNIDECPELPYQAATSGHFFFDLVYNPAETLFLKKGKAYGAHICNGLEMLHLQAERAWEIWNDFN